jgi:mannose-6-phosphate isomerase-like protein (cupin superfamily)
MTIHRIYVDSEGESHTEVLEGCITPYGVPEPERTIPATGISFMRRDRDTFPGFHHTPRRQYIVVLSGWMTFEVGDGVKIELKPGDAVLVEDTHGRGHITKGVADVVFLHLSDQS